MTRTVPRTHARWRTGVAIGAASALAVGGALIASPGIAQNLQVDDALFDWQVNAESGGAAPLPGTCHFLAAGEVGDTGGTSGFDESYYAAESGNTTIVKPDSAGVDHVATWDDKCLDPNGNPTRTAADSTSGNRVQITGGTGTVDPDTDTGYIQWDGSWSFVYYSSMTSWTVNDPRLEVEDGHGRIVGTFTGYGASMEDLGKWESLPAVEGTVADFADATVDLTEDGFTVTPDYLGVETETGGSGFDQRSHGRGLGLLSAGLGGLQHPHGSVRLLVLIGRDVRPEEADEADRRDLHGARDRARRPDGTRVVRRHADHGLARVGRGRLRGVLRGRAPGRGRRVGRLHDGGDVCGAHRPHRGHGVPDPRACGRRRGDLSLGDGDHRDRGRAPADRRAHGDRGLGKDGLQVLLEGSDFTVDRLPPNSAGVAPNQMSSIGYGIVPSSTPHQTVRRARPGVRLASNGS